MEAALELGNRSMLQEVLEVWTPRVMLVKAQKGKRGELGRCLHPFREYLHNCEHSARNMDGKGHSEGFPRETRRKGGPCYAVAENLTELCLWSSALWKVDLVNHGSRGNLSAKH